MMLGGTPAANCMATLKKWRNARLNTAEITAAGGIIQC